jgi:hypothetical protein
VGRYFHIDACAPAETDTIIISFVIAIAIAAAQSMLTLRLSAPRLDEARARRRN